MVRDFIAEKDEFLEDEEKIDDPDEYREKVEEGDIDADIYEEEGEEILEENDEITPEEASFMEGARKGGQGAKCRECGKILKDDEDIVETEMDEEILRFCSEKCLEKYVLKHS